MKNATFLFVKFSLTPTIVKALFMVQAVLVVGLLYAQPCVTEICNGIDDDCDNLIDEGVQTAFYIDYDGDGFPNPVIYINACWPNYNGLPFWYTSPGNDCDDADMWVTGGPMGDCVYLEQCNGIDDDGNGFIDDDDPGLAGAKIYWYQDADGDGYVNPAIWVKAACSPPEGYRIAPSLELLPYWQDGLGDCDDTNPSVNPGALEINCNGIDDNCDGLMAQQECNSTDTDCDGVPDDFDVCPGGDDSVDNNTDNIPDCSQLLNYNDYSPDWQCGNNKIYVCHNDNNPHTICIDANALLPAHYEHGDKIGPCTSCAQNLIIPDTPGKTKTDSTRLVLEVSQNPDHKEVTFHQHEFETEPAMLILHPNPATDNIQLRYAGVINEIRLISSQGLVIRSFDPGADFRKLSLDQIPSGLYVLMVSSGGSWLTKKFIKL